MKPDRQQNTHATFFFALAHKRRQMLCSILLDAGAKGLTFGELAAQSGLSDNTLAHHLRFMEKGGILRRRPEKNRTRITLNIVYLVRTLTRFGDGVTAQLIPNRQTMVAQRGAFVT